MCSRVSLTLCVSSRARANSEKEFEVRKRGTVWERSGVEIQVFRLFPVSLFGTAEWAHSQFVTIF